MLGTSMNSAALLFSQSDVLLDVELLNKQALFEAVGRLWNNVTASPQTRSLPA